MHNSKESGQMHRVRSLSWANKAMRQTDWQDNHRTSLVMFGQYNSISISIYFVLTLKWPNSPKFSALRDQISQRNSKKIYKQKLLWFIMIRPGYNVYEFNSALEELNKNEEKKIFKNLNFLNLGKKYCTTMHTKIRARPSTKTLQLIAYCRVVLGYGTKNSSRLVASGHSPRSRLRSPLAI
jgi:hypothetical protein